MFFDSVHGGFGDGPKFPSVPPLSLSLRQSDRTKDLPHQEKVLHQLRMMAPGGIYTISPVLGRSGRRLFFYGQAW